MKIHLIRRTSKQDHIHPVNLGHLLGTCRALEDLLCVLASHLVQAVLRNNVAALQQHGVVALGVADLLGHWADEDVVECKVGAQVHFARHLLRIQARRQVIIVHACFPDPESLLGN